MAPSALVAGRLEQRPEAGSGAPLLQILGHLSAADSRGSEPTQLETPGKLDDASAYPRK